MKQSTKETLILIIGVIAITSFGFIYNEIKTSSIEIKPKIELIDNIQKNKDNINQLEAIKNKLNNNQ